MLLSWRLQQYSGAGSAQTFVSASVLYGASVRSLLIGLASLVSSIAARKAATPSLLAIPSILPAASKISAWEDSLGARERSLAPLRAILRAFVGLHFYSRRNLETGKIAA